MNKHILATSLLLFPTLCLASSDAILNVEGEIQVNGKTVINSQGKLVNQNLDKDFISLSNYFPNSVKVVTLDNLKNYPDVEEQSFFYDGTGMPNKAVRRFIAKFYSIEREIVQENDNYKHIREVHNTDAETSSTTIENFYTLYKPFSDKLYLYTPNYQVEVYKEVRQKTETDDLFYKNHLKRKISTMTYLGKTSYTKRDGTSLSDCILISETTSKNFNNSFDTDDTYNNILCKNYGYVSYNNFELLKVEE